MKRGAMWQPLGEEERAALVEAFLQKNPERRASRHPLGHLDRYLWDQRLGVRRAHRAKSVKGRYK